MFARLHARALLRFTELVADVLDQHAAVLTTDAEHVGLVHVEVQTHDSRVSRDLLLWLLLVLKRLHLDVPYVLRLILVAPDGHCKHVLLERIPYNARDHLGSLGVLGV